jgi:DNA-binding response OmpR family regulator
MRILFIEDNVTTSHSVERFLKLKYEVLVALTCAESLALIDQRPDLILLDIGLPDCDGIRLIRYIRNRMPTVPIIAATAFAMVEERAQCFEAGCTDYLRKPYELSALLELVQKYDGMTRV